MIKPMVGSKIKITSLDPWAENIYAKDGYIKIINCENTPGEWFTINIDGTDYELNKDSFIVKGTKC